MGGLGGEALCVPCAPVMLGSFGDITLSPKPKPCLVEQGNDEDMLPESLLGTIRLKHLELSAAPFLDVAAKKASPPPAPPCTCACALGGGRNFQLILHLSGASGGIRYLNQCFAK